MDGKTPGVLDLVRLSEGRGCETWSSTSIWNPWVPETSTLLSVDPPFASDTSFAEGLDVGGVGGREGRPDREP